MKAKSIARACYLSFTGKFLYPSKRTHFLNGHYVSENQLSIDQQHDLFYDQLKSLSSYGDLISPTEALLNIYQKSSTKICLTFDDGYEDVYTIIAPVLKAFGLKAIFFINPVFIGLAGNDAYAVLSNRYQTPVRKNFLTHQQLQSLVNEGHVIGSHTSTHMRLNGGDHDLLYSEILISKSKIEQMTGVPCDCFAYPFGGKNDLSSEALKLASTCFKYIFSSINSEGLLSFDNRVINRRHFEGSWPVSHIRYFLSNRNF